MNDFGEIQFNLRAITMLFNTSADVMSLWTFWLLSFSIWYRLCVAYFFLYLTCCFNHVRGASCMRDCVANVKILFHFLCISVVQIHRIFGMLSIKIMLFIFLFLTRFVHQSKLNSLLHLVSRMIQLECVCRYLVSHCDSLTSNNGIFCHSIFACKRMPLLKLQNTHAIEPQSRYRTVWHEIQRWETSNDFLWLCMGTVFQQRHSRIPKQPYRF